MVFFIGFFGFLIFELFSITIKNLSLWKKTLKLRKFNCGTVFKVSLVCFFVSTLPDIWRINIDFNLTMKANAIDVLPSSKSKCHGWNLSNNTLYPGQFISDHERGAWPLLLFYSKGRQTTWQPEMTWYLEQRVPEAAKEVLRCIRGPNSYSMGTFRLLDYIIAV